MSSAWLGQAREVVEEGTAHRGPVTGSQQCSVDAYGVTKDHGRTKALGGRKWDEIWASYGGSMCWPRGEVQRVQGGTAILRVRHTSGKPSGHSPAFLVTDIHGAKLRRSCVYVPGSWQGAPRASLVGRMRAKPPPRSL